MDTPSITQKTCIDCKQTLSINLYHRNHTYADGYVRTCIDCTAVRRGRKPPFRDHAPDGYRTCTSCHNVFPETFEFFYHSNDGRLGFAARCRKCQHASIRRYAENNPEKYREVKKRCELKRRDKREQYVQKNKEHIRARLKRYYAENVDRKRKYARDYRLVHLDEKRQANRQWKLDNPELVRMQIERRRARKLGLPNTYTQVAWGRCLEYFHYSCAVCGRQFRDLFNKHTLAADHWIPLTASDCPGTVAPNMICLCHGEGGCNNLKGSKDPILWLSERYGKRKAKPINERIQQYFEWVRTQEEH